MSLLSEIDSLLSPVIPIETGVFSGKAPDRYAVVTPIGDTLTLYADDSPESEVQQARLSLFDRGNYTAVKNSMIRALLAAGITVTDSRYIGHEDDTGYHHYAIDVASVYELEE